MTAAVAALVAYLIAGVAPSYWVLGLASVILLLITYVIRKLLARQAPAAKGYAGIWTRNAPPAGDIAQPGTRSWNSQQLVRIIRHGGAFVSVPTKDEVLAAFAVRIPLEGMAARLTAVHHTSEEIHQMRQILHQEEEAYRLKRRDEAYKLSGEFHEQIAKASRNEFLRRFVPELLAYVDPCLILFDPFKAQPSRSPRAHAQILQMIEARDAEGAERAMVEHIVHTAKVGLLQGQAGGHPFCRSPHGN